MTTTAAAIYENGVLRPLSPLPLPEGARVEVTVTDEAATPPPSGATVIELMRQVAALPMESGGEGFSGRDHDRVLYGAPASDT